MNTFIRISFLISLFIGYSSGAELPSDVKQLLSKRNEAVAKIDEIFLKELEKLKVKYTKQGDLESANKTVDLIEKYSQESPKTVPKIEDELIGRWIGRTSSGLSPEYFFMRNGNVNDGKWRIANNGKKLVCTWPDGTSDTFDLPPVNNVLSGISSRGPTITATKMKE